MKKIFKWLLSGFIALIALLLIVAILLPFFLPLDKIKDFAAEKLGESIKREVRVGGISVNIFSGVSLKKLYIGNRAGFTNAPFISADAIELRFDLWPLILERKIKIYKLVLVKPEIFIEKAPSGELNASDLMGAPGKKTEAPGKKGAAPLDFTVSQFSVSGGKLKYVDRTFGKPKESSLGNLDLDISNITLKALSPMTIKAGATGFYLGKPIQLGMNGKVEIDQEREKIKISDFTTRIEKDSILTNLEISGFKEPKVSLKISSTSFALDPLIALLSGSEKEVKAAKYGELTGTINKTMASLPPGLTLNGTVSIKNLSYKNMKIDDISAKLGVLSGISTVDLEGIKAYDGTLSGKAKVNLRAPGLSYSVSEIDLRAFNAAPFTNALISSFFPEQAGLANKVEGMLQFSGNLSGTGVEQPDILANLKGSGSIELKNGKIVDPKSIKSIGEKIGVSLLKGDITLSSLTAKLSVRNKMLNVSPLKLKDNDIKVDFDGSLDLEALSYVAGNTLTVWLSPAAAKSLPKEYEMLKDKTGAASMDFMLTGSLTKPIPLPKFDTIVKKVIEKEQEKATQKIKEEVNKQGEKILKDLLKIK
ncbi:MAG: AsmA family protein [Candidatus Saganbacteria bacterium]|nr:AsmA family protein [Candidatus Saganbacteria bacterium]